jgi:hypothetical protein
MISSIAVSLANREGISSHATAVTAVPLTTASGLTFIGAIRVHIVCTAAFNAQVASALRRMNTQHVANPQRVG